MFYLIREILSLQLVHAAGRQPCSQANPAGSVSKQTVARAHRPPFVRESTLGSSCNKVASLLGSALSLPVTPAQEQSLNCRDHRDHTGQTDLSWARDEWAHFCTGGGHPSLRPGNSVPIAPSHAAECPRGAWANLLRPNPRLGCWTCNFLLPGQSPQASLQRSLSPT